ncbi:MAG: chromosome segregation protein SMC [Pseudomonadota bacterium]
MRLSRIKLAGFKSFVDPTTISFPSNLVGVVGPNGCGKSNVIDAVRWVMGESSASRLRGDSMTDVIFNGSSARKPVGTASIELIFDNSDGTVGGQYAQYSEIAIRRSVTRDGASSYFLNGTKCRRKDITGIFLGTGLGPRSYSIIEQGMISRLIEAKPEEMRVYIEEAAGISKYKERRRETENRIRHTRENLERLTDLLDEVEKQIKHLDRQAKAAERYKKYKAEERQAGAELLAMRLRVLDNRAAELDRELASAETALQAAVAEQRRIEAQIEQTREQHGEATEQFNEAQAHYYRVGAEISRLEQAIEHAAELRQRQQADLDQAIAGAAEIRSHINDDQAQLEQLTSTLTELAPGLEAAAERAARSGSSLTQSENAMADWREHWDQFNAEAYEAEQTLKVEHSRQEQWATAVQQLSQRRERLSDDQRPAELDELRSTLAQLAGAVDGQSARTEEADRNLASLREQYDGARQKERDLRDELQASQDALQNVRTELATQRALQRAALGAADEQLADWLETSGLNRNKRLVEVLDVQAGWESAVETVLQQTLQAIVVDDIEQAASLAASLESGDAHLVRRTAATGAPTPGTLAEKVSGAPSNVHDLLAGVRVAPTLAAALERRADLSESESLVTANGEWVGRDFFYVHRLSAQSNSVVRREGEIRALSEQVTAAEDKQQQVAQALDHQQRRLAELETARDQAQAAASLAQQERSDAVAKREQAALRVRQAEERQQIVERECRSIDDEVGRTQELMRASQERIDEAKATTATLDERRAALEQQRVQLSNELDRVREQAEQDRAAAQDLRVQFETRKSSQDSAAQSLARMQTQLVQFERRESELQAQITAAEQPGQEREQLLAESLNSRVNAEQRLGEARERREAIESQLRRFEAERGDAEEGVVGAREGLDHVRMQAQENRVRQEGLLEQFDDAQFDRQALLANLDEAATVEAWEENLAKLAKRIERLGAINLAAIDEFREQSERKEYLDAQFADLQSALETLENAIKKIDRETRSRFKETFDAIDIGFKRLFPRLFGGGHAYLQLTGDDLLSTGVTVMAQPPGKRNSTIHLLSGGEKALTAVALVFAIFELNPAPFCMLDEVDAPLDDANVNRYCDIVREMSESVQFVFITHNKVTMEMARQLSGVTMQEPGVSRLVTVDLDEAIKLAVS